MIKRLNFFHDPKGLPMRQYEALRAYHYEQCSVEEAAARGGYAEGSFRNLLTRFKKNPTLDFFWPTKKVEPPPKKNPRRARILQLRREDGLTINQIQARLKEEKIPASMGYIQKIFTEEGIKRLPKNRKMESSRSRTIADRRNLDLSPRSFHTGFGGLFLFAFDLARMKIDTMVHNADLPGTTMIPPECAFLSLLALKLYGIGRPSHVMAETLDEGLGLFTGLNVIPKRTTLTEYSIEVDPKFSDPLMHQWYHAAVRLSDVIGGGQSVDLDFHTIPYHGDDALLQKHYISKRGRSQRGILTVLARDADSHVFCYADPTVRKETQNESILRFVNYWKAQTGTLPKELVFDSRFTIHAYLGKLTDMGINYITLRRKSDQLIQHIHTLPLGAWKKIRLTNISRAYRNPKVIEEIVKLRNTPHKVRQLFIKGLGNNGKPTVMLTNQMKRSPTQLIDRYARRMVIENVISDAIKFFHLDSLSSVVPMRINVDTQLTVMASVLYRLLGVRAGDGYEHAEAERIFRELVRLTGKVTITEDEIIVALRLRAKTGFLIKAGYQDFQERIPWLENKVLRIKFVKHP